MNQRLEILYALKRGDSLTPLAALKRYGCMRLGARIHEIRELGFAVKTRLVKRGTKHIAEYWL